MIYGKFIFHLCCCRRRVGLSHFCDYVTQSTDLQVTFFSFFTSWFFDCVTHPLSTPPNRSLSPSLRLPSRKLSIFFSKFHTRLSATFTHKISLLFFLDFLLSFLHTEIFLQSQLDLGWNGERGKIRGWKFFAFHFCWRDEENSHDHCIFPTFTRSSRIFTRHNANGKMGMWNKTENLKILTLFVF